MPTIIKNGRNYSGTSVSLTQAEYDALPEVTKMNGTTYFITDSEVVLDADNVALGNGTVEDLAGSVAVIETETASANRSVGDHILLNGQLYTVTSPVATGETYAVGTNITATNVGAELTALNNGLTPVTLSLTSSYTLTNASFSMGKMVVVSCKVAGLNGSSNLEVATIPSAYVPDTEIPLVGTTNSGVLITGWIRAYTGELVIAPRSSLSNAEARVLAVYHI